NWQMAARMFGDMGGSREEAETALATGKVIEESTGGAFVAMFTEQNMALDVQPLLGQLPARSLLLYRVDDSVVRLAVGQALAAAIPNARLVPLQGKTHGAFSGNWERVVGVITEFLDEDRETRALIVAPPPPTASGSTFRTVLFTDLVGHTDMMSRLGDERGRAVLREHERITREVLKANGGNEVKTMGDGFMASFGSVTRAVECAVALQRAFAEREGEPLNVRGGLNAGEPIEEDGHLFGATVILASRIAAKAEGGEILVADTVRGLCSGKG